MRLPKFLKSFLSHTQAFASGVEEAQQWIGKRVNRALDMENEWLYLEFQRIFGEAFFRRHIEQFRLIRDLCYTLQGNTWEIAKLIGHLQRLPLRNYDPSIWRTFLSRICTVIFPWEKYHTFALSGIHIAEDYVISLAIIKYTYQHYKLEITVPKDVTQTLYELRVAKDK